MKTVTHLTGPKRYICARLHNVQGGAAGLATAKGEGANLSLQGTISLSSPLLPSPQPLSRDTGEGLIALSRLSRLRATPNLA